MQPLDRFLLKRPEFQGADPFSLLGTPIPADPHVMLQEVGFLTVSMSDNKMPREQQDRLYARIDLLMAAYKKHRQENRQ